MKLLKAMRLVFKDVVRSNTAEFIVRAVAMLLACFVVGLLTTTVLVNFTEGIFEDSITVGSFFETPMDVFSLTVLGALAMSGVMGVGLVLVILFAAVYHTVQFFRRPAT